MANWYVSSVAYAAISAWAATTAYTVGQIVRPTAAAAGKKIAYRCTTAGTSGSTEPAWGTTLGGTTASGAATFTAINSDTYGWSGAVGDLSSVCNVSTSGFGAVGDKIFLSSDHAETTANNTNFLSSLTGSWGSATTFIISVNRGGSVPPVAADIASGASITFNNLYLDAPFSIYIEGVTLAASAGNIYLNNGSFNTCYLKNSSLQLTGSSSAYRITQGNPCETILDNTSLSFANSGQSVNFSFSQDLTWINTASPIAGTAPTNLFSTGSNCAGLITCRGVDFSSYTGTIFQASSSGAFVKLLLDSCKISSSATIYGGTADSAASVVELVNCWDGTSVRNERYVAAGKVVTERTITLTGGASDDVGAFSLKLISNSSKLDKWVDPLATFWLDVENTSVGVSHTATVEIVSSASLNNDDIWLNLEYMGTSGNPIASFANSLPATPVSANAAVTTSSAGWASSPATPVYQKLQVTFTPQRAGRVRGQVMLGKASTTVYVNPVITIT